MLRSRVTAFNAIVLVAALIAVPAVPAAASTAQSLGVPAVTNATTAASCTVADFDQAAGKTAAAGFTRVECVQGWGLAAGPKYLDLFRQKAGHWAVVKTVVNHGNAWSTYFRDPEGNSLEVATPGLWPTSWPGTRWP